MGRTTPDDMDESTEITHHDQGVSFEVKLQSGSASDRTTVKAKLKTESEAEFEAKRDAFQSEVRDGAEQAHKHHEAVFGDDD